MKVRINDTVLITAGKDKGKTGKVTKVNRKTSKITVENVNIKVKHIKKTQGRQGEKITFESPIHISNVKVICPSTKKPTRIGYVKEGKHKKRVAKVSKEVITEDTTKHATRSKRK